MAATTYPEFDANTEAVQVAEVFAQGIQGKTILITGVNRGGIGFSTAYAFASQSPTCLIITGRTPSKLQESIHALKSDFPNVTYKLLQVDLSAQKSVREAAATLLSWTDVPTLDIIVNSAGIMAMPERTLSEDGIEMHFATNHIGHWLLSCLLMPKLIEAAENNPVGATRIVNVSAASPQVSGIRWSDINLENKNIDLPLAEQPDYEWFAMCGCPDIQELSYVPLDGYNRSKVANVLFGIGANKRLLNKYGILSLGLHPGVMATELGRNMSPEVLANFAELMKTDVFKAKTLGAGASTSLVAALDPKLAVGVGESKNGVENWGSYLDDCQISSKAHRLSASTDEADRLWKLSEQLVGESFDW